MSSTKLLTYCLAPPLYELFFDISYNKDKRISPAPTELLLAQTRSYSPYDDLSCSHLSKSWRQDPSSCSSCIRTEIAFDTYFVRAPCLNWFSLQPGLLFDWRLDWALATRPSWVHSVYPLVKTRLERWLLACASIVFCKPVTLFTGLDILTQWALCRPWSHDCEY